jgi:hypothetical protein
VSPRPDHRHHVRRVLLPSGKTIEVVFFEDREPGPAPASDASRSTAPAAGQGPSEAAPPTDDLHRCGSCGADLVYPVDWEEAGAQHWEVTLRCPNCEWSGTGVFDQAAVERFDDELDRGTEALVRDLKRLMHANMEADIERFVEALEQDHITPEDF